jgi:outer membrane protein
MAQIAAETDRGKAATASLKSKSEKLTSKVEAKQKQLEKQKAAIESKLETLSPKERAAKAKEFQKKVEEYQKFVRSSELEMQQMQDALTTELSQAIKQAAIEYGKEHGYAAVVIKKDTLYLAESVNSKDLTDELVHLLNKKSEKK